MKSHDRVLGFSVGNSTLRFGVLEGDRVLEPRSVPWTAVASGGLALDDLLDRMAPRGSVIASVRDDHRLLLESKLPSACLPVAVARRDFALPIRNLYESPSEAGTDRLLALIAAHRRSSGAGAIVVDFGTATTLSVVSPACEFLGGTISAGAGTVARGLSVLAPMLPSVRVGEPEERAGLPGGDSVVLERADDFLARSTRTALRTGVFWSVAGGVRAILVRLLESVPFRPRVYATGGEARLFCGVIEEVEEVVSDLVLEGLAVSQRARGG